MTQRPRRQFTTEQKAEAVRILNHAPTAERSSTGKSVNQVAKEMSLTPSALSRWVKQAQIDQAKAPNGALTTEERQELVKLRRDVKRLQMERDFLTAVASSGWESLQRDSHRNALPWEPRQRTASKRPQPLASHELRSMQQRTQVL